MIYEVKIMGRKHWKTIYKELEKPTELVSDDGHSMCVIGKYDRDKAFDLIKQALGEYYGLNTEEYHSLKGPHDLKVSFLRRPNPIDDEDIEANFVAELSSRTMPRENDVWIYFVP